MLCTNCGKAQANEYRQVSEGKELVLRLCPECYRRLYSARDEDLVSLLGSMGGSKRLVCPVCDTTYEEFRRTGILGCAHCYTAFRAELEPTVHYMQGSVKHTGKKPFKNVKEAYEIIMERDACKRELERAVRARDFARVTELKKRIEELGAELLLEEE